MLKTAKNESAEKEWDGGGPFLMNIGIVYFDQRFGAAHSECL